MAKTEKDIKKGTENWMNLFINIDRNKATGWEGYDFAVNVGGEGVISSYTRWATRLIPFPETRFSSQFLKAFWVRPERSTLNLNGRIPLRRTTY